MSLQEAAKCCCRLHHCCLFIYFIINVIFYSLDDLQTNYKKQSELAEGKHIFIYFQMFFCVWIYLINVYWSLSVLFLIIIELLHLIKSEKKITNADTWRNKQRKTSATGTPAFEISASSSRPLGCVWGFSADLQLLCQFLLLLDSFRVSAACKLCAAVCKLDWKCFSCSLFLFRTRRWKWFQ